MAADRDGNIYVAGEGGGGIRVYDSAGALLRVLGREGSGPGEFRHKYSLAWAGDTLAVYDPGNGRVEFIDREGHWVASHPNARISGPQVRFRQATPRIFYSPSFMPAASGRGITRVYLRDGFGALPDTMIVPDSFPATPYAVTCAGNGVSVWSSPSAPAFMSGVSPEGWLVTWRTDAYRVTFSAHDGRVMRTITENERPIALPDSAWVADLADYAKWRAE